VKFWVLIFCHQGTKTRSLKKKGLWVLLLSLQSFCFSNLAFYDKMQVNGLKIYDANL